MINQEMKRKMLISFLLHNISTLDLPITKPYLTIFGDLLLDNMFFVKSWSIYSIFYWRIALPLFCSVSNLGLNDWKGQCAIVWWYLGTSSSIQRKKRSFIHFPEMIQKGGSPSIKGYGTNHLCTFSNLLLEPPKIVYTKYYKYWTYGIDTQLVVFALFNTLVSSR